MGKDWEDVLQCSSQSDIIVFKKIRNIIRNSKGTVKQKVEKPEDPALNDSVYKEEFNI